MSEEIQMGADADCGCLNMQRELDVANARGINRASNHNDNFMAFMDRQYVILGTQSDPIEAVAIRQLMHREAPLDRT
jgi:hypothetical protein